ncbi:MAG: hypothetical protein LBF65_02275 [Holosporales bacterium]|jgi:fructose-specific component phosphotransferase system IIB-like protein|nr:hypothetical protein [Holosporales bacterium]
MSKINTRKFKRNIVMALAITIATTAAPLGATLQAFKKAAEVYQVVIPLEDQILPQYMWCMGQIITAASNVTEGGEPGNNSSAIWFDMYMATTAMDRHWAREFARLVGEVLDEVSIRPDLGPNHILDLLIARDSLIGNTYNHDRLAILEELNKTESPFLGFISEAFNNRKTVRRTKISNTYPIIGKYLMAYKMESFGITKTQEQDVLIREVEQALEDPPESQANVFAQRLKALESLPDLTRMDLPPEFKDHLQVFEQSISQQLDSNRQQIINEYDRTQSSLLARLIRIHLPERQAAPEEPQVGAAPVLTEDTIPVEPSTAGEPATDGTSAEGTEEEPEVTDTAAADQNISIINPAADAPIEIGDSLPLQEPDPVPTEDAIPDEPSVLGEPVTDATFAENTAEPDMPVPTQEPDPVPTEDTIPDEPSVLGDPAPDATATPSMEGEPEVIDTAAADQHIKIIDTAADAPIEIGESLPSQEPDPVPTEDPIPDELSSAGQTVPEATSAESPEGEPVMPVPMAEDAMGDATGLEAAQQPGETLVVPRSQQTPCILDCRLPHSTPARHTVLSVLDMTMYQLTGVYQAVKIWGVDNLIQDQGTVLPVRFDSGINAKTWRFSRRMRRAEINGYLLMFGLKMSDLHQLGQADDSTMSLRVLMKSDAGSGTSQVALEIEEPGQSWRPVVREEDALNILERFGLERIIELPEV